MVFSRTGKSLKMVGGLRGKFGKSVNSSNNVFLKYIEGQPDGKIQQGLEKSWKFVSEKGYEP